MSSASPRVLDHARSAVQGRHWTVRLAPSLAWWLSVLAILLVTIFVRIFVAPDEFADFASYLELAQDVAGSSMSSLWPLEPLSRGLLLWSTEIFGSAESGAIAVHWLNSAVFVAGLALVSAHRTHGWHGLLVVWGLYGALLGFVTLRATPAYLLVAYAVLHLSNRPVKGTLVLILAAGFHASALLMLGPWLCNALLSSSRQQSPGGFHGSRRRALWVFFCVGCYFLTSGGLGNSDLLVEILSRSETTAKYAIYAEFAAVGENLQSLGHRAYFGGLTLLTLLAAVTRHEATLRIWPYVAAAFLLTALAAASPVVSFRLSLFWTIPLLTSFPWDRWTRSDLRLSGMAVAIVLLFALGFRAALAPISG